MSKFQTACDIEQLKWSPDDSFIMCVSLKANVVHLRSIKSCVIEMNLDGWYGIINEEMLAGAAWAPDSRSIITFTEL